MTEKKRRSRKEKCKYRSTIIVPVNRLNGDQLERQPLVPIDFIGLGKKEGLISMLEKNYCKTKSELVSGGGFSVWSGVGKTFYITDQVATRFIAKSYS